MHSITGSKYIEIRDLSETKEGMFLESVDGTIILETNLKPLRDRMHFAGWTTITDEKSWVVKDGFKISFPHKNLWRSYKAELYFPRIMSGIQRGYLRAIRYEDWYLDQPFQKQSGDTTFGNYLSLMFKREEGSDDPEIPISISESLSSRKIKVSPYRGATRREILYQLSKELEFFWTLDLTFGIIFFINDERPGRLKINDVPIEINRGRRTTTGWQLTDEYGIFLYPGTLMEYSRIQDQKMVIASVKSISKMGTKPMTQYLFVEPEYTYVTYWDIKQGLDSKSYTFNVEEEPVPPSAEIDILARDYNFMMVGQRADVFGRTDFLNPRILEKQTVFNVDDLSPWATKDGYGMAFPRQDKKHVSVTIPITPIKSVRIGDVVHGVWNKDGEAFHLKMPDGYLFYEIDNDLGNKLYSSLPDGSVIGGKTKAELIAEEDIFRGSAWKMKGWSSVTISAGGEKSVDMPETVPLPDDENFISLLAGGQATIQVKGEDGFFGFNSSNTDESLGGGGITSIKAGSGIVDVILNPSGQTEIVLDSDNVKIGSGVANDPVVRKSDLDALVQKFNSHTHPYVDTPVGSSTTSATTSPHTSTASSKVFSE